MTYTNKTKATTISPKSYLEKSYTRGTYVKGVRYLLCVSGDGEKVVPLGW